jgi:hypothetical protein
MQVCTKCDGRGFRIVELSTSERVEKSCYVCSGNGFLLGVSAVAVVVPPKLKVPQIPKEKPNQAPIPMRAGLSAPLGDLSFLGSKRQVYG